MSTVSIHYRDYWDRPRVFVVVRNGRWVLFDCPFLDERDDYSDRYSVALIEPAPELLDESADWTGIADRVVRVIGQVPVGDVSFPDRSTIDDAVLRRLDLD
jgi:hypothetical protein